MTIIPHPLKKAEESEDDRWVTCSSENDGNLPPIRGWSPPEGEKYVAVDISFADWNPSLTLPAGPALVTNNVSPFPTFLGNALGAINIEIGFGLNVAGIQPSESQETIRAGDNTQTPRATRANEDMAGMGVETIEVVPSTSSTNVEATDIQHD